MDKDSTACLEKNQEAVLLGLRIVSRKKEKHCTQRASKPCRRRGSHVKDLP